MDKIGLKETKVTHKSDNMMMNVYRNIGGFYLHWHDEYEFLYAHSDCTVIADGYTYTLTEGDVLLIEGGVLHSKSPSFSGSCTATVIHPHLLGDDSLSYFGNGITYKHLFRRGDVIADKIIQNITDINKCFDERKFGYELRIKSLISDLFASLIEGGYYVIAKERPGSSDVFKELIDCIHENYRKSITLDSLCKISNYSKSYIIRLFKKHTAQTPVSYINNFRLSKAAELLSNTRLSVLDVSLECGFENTGHFIALFKKRYGTTPLKWKNGKQSN